MRDPEWGDGWNPGPYTTQEWAEITQKFPRKMGPLRIARVAPYADPSRSMTRLQRFMSRWFV